MTGLTEFRFLAPDTFEIQAYNSVAPFASFFPGIAGLWGKPLWAFYVNRGQAIASFGVENKDRPIFEFVSASRAYQQTALRGFRTFIRATVAGSADSVFWEPFQGNSASMIIRPSELELCDHHAELGLQLRVRYTTVSQQPFAGLIRQVEVKNTLRQPLSIEWLDGAAEIVPKGYIDWFIKHIPRTTEGWVVVENFAAGQPFYKLKVIPSDHPEVLPNAGGNGVAMYHDPVKRSLVVVDPEAVFGDDSSFRLPKVFIDGGTPMAKQRQHNLMPCAMQYLSGDLVAGQKMTLHQVYVQCDSLANFQARAAECVKPDFVAEQFRVSAKLMNGITDVCAQKSALPVLDAYVRQNFLDNVMRGGMPVLLPTRQGPRALYVYGRKHGDLERDYNAFQLAATYYSQGNGHYRDVIQNRRCDVWFYPQIGLEGARFFLNLLQSDGHNPLVIEGQRFTLSSNADIPALSAAFTDAARGASFLKQWISMACTPGQFLEALEAEGLVLTQDRQIFLENFLSQCACDEQAAFHEGYWSDHWHYNLDLLEAVFAIYPDQKTHFMFKDRSFYFYDSPATVVPRSEKLVDFKGALRQFRAVRRSAEKEALIQSRTEFPQRMRANQGRGTVYYCTAFVKMWIVFLNKLASLDPEQTGLSMDSDKPNWYDALNGLPGLLGSSLCETIELQRWINFLLQALEGFEATALFVPVEAQQCYQALTLALDKRLSGQITPFDFWDQSHTAKERFRAETRLGFLGDERALSVPELKKFLQQASALLKESMHKGLDESSGLPYTYFWYQATEWIPRADPSGQALKNVDGYALVEPRRFKRCVLPLFLEGPVHWLRLCNQTEAQKMMAALKKSELYDSQLGMYKVCASLEAERLDIGRARVFPRGWLEHESVWLHMHYKYLLEMLRGGQTEPFFAEAAAGGLIPFRDAAQYGRSILENSSFLVSSANDQATLHGRGFVARLSGSTAEFIQMWLWICAGREPFRLAAGRLQFLLNPLLPGWLFDEQEVFEFTFLGHTQVRYLNAKKQSTYGPTAVAVQGYTFIKKTSVLCEIKGAVVEDSALALRIRNGEFDAIEIQLA